MATKHMYMLEDVLATLLYAIQTQHTTLAFQCARELAESREHDALWNTLTLAWILTDPARTPTHVGAFLSNDPYMLVQSLLNGEAYNLPEFFPSMLGNGKDIPSSNYTDYTPIPWTKIPTSWSNEQAYACWKTVCRAFKHKHWEKALRLTMPLLHTDYDSIVDLLNALGMPHMATLLESTIFLPLAERVLAHAFASYNAITSECSYTLPSSSQYRDFSISLEALRVWHIQPKPIRDLRGNPLSILHTNGSMYWKDICFDSMNVEEFYATHFPIDIPDEWSTEECSKSHGGTLPTEEVYENLWIPAFLLLTS